MTSLTQNFLNPNNKPFVIGDFTIRQDEGGRFSCAATEYKYDIDMQAFTVLICRGEIFKIDVKNK